jgi:uncharacterized protein YwgA
MQNIARQPKYKRQRFLLAFILQLHDGVTLTDLQNLVFFHTMTERLDYYEFVPFKFGPYSFQLEEDLEILQRDGYILFDGSNITAIEETKGEVLFQIQVEKGEDFVKKIYRFDPYYTIRSGILVQLFSGKELEQFQRVRQDYVRTEQVLFTTGYEGRSAEGFLNSLIQNDVRVLCDVRKNPFSHKFGFSKGKLEYIAQEVGIKYVSISALGIESEKRGTLETSKDYQHLFEEFAKSLPDRQTFLEEVYTLLRTNVRIALMCYEHEPERCHRHVIRDYLVRTHQIKSEDL